MFWGKFHSHPFYFVEITINIPGNEIVVLSLVTVKGAMLQSIFEEIVSSPDNNGETTHIKLEISKLDYLVHYNSVMHILAPHLYNQWLRFQKNPMRKTSILHVRYYF